MESLWMLLALTVVIEQINENIFIGLFSVRNGS